MCFRTAVGLIILAVSSYLVLSCPNSCLCITQYEGVIVHCNGTGLTDIPRNIPNDAYAIHMDKNPITIIENGTFQNVTSLYTLNLYWCNISTIETNAFINLPNLQNLYLGNNSITYLHQATFKELSALIKLDLRNNRITTLQNGIFQDNQALQDLSLSGNNLTFVRNDTFEHNINLQFLFLDLVCDCNVAFWSWLKTLETKRYLYGVIKCLDRNGIDLSSLQASDFDNCDGKL
ncbi:reticulon-4 receptor-like 1 isoform X2 [Mytilus edulis]